jgi:cell wall-associated NlpC family hydrolase
MEGRGHLRLFIVGLVTCLCVLAVSPSAMAVLPPKHWAVATYSQYYRGSPYLAGGATPEGFDEAGLVAFVYAQFGIAAPHDVAGLAAAGHEVDEDTREPGDVMVWAEVDGTKRAGIYVGGGAVICASAEGGIVRYEFIDADQTPPMPLPTPLPPKELITTRRLGSFTGHQAAVLARRQLGVPYLAGGQDRQGFDAAGLTRFVYGQLEVWLPTKIGPQAYMGRPADLKSLREGDLVFWGGRGRDYVHYCRVGIYVGHGRVVCAKRSAGRAVEMPLLHAMEAQRLLPIL